MMCPLRHTHCARHTRGRRSASVWQPWCCPWWRMRARTRQICSRTKVGSVEGAQHRCACVDTLLRVLLACAGLWPRRWALLIAEPWEASWNPLFWSPAAAAAQGILAVAALAAVALALVPVPLARAGNGPLSLPAAACGVCWCVAGWQGLNSNRPCVLPLGCACVGWRREMQRRWTARRCRW